MHDELDKAITALSHWQRTEDRLIRSIKFDDFPQAIHFMSSAVPLCEKLNHHPDWTNSYNKLDISLTTHDAGGLTEKDVQLAKGLDELAARIGAA